MVVSALALGIAGLGVTATTRKLLGASGPVLPYSLCRAGHSTAVLPALTPRRILTSWQWDPVASIALAAVGFLYLRGARHLARLGTRWPWWRTGSFLAGLGVVVAATSGSVAVYGMALFQMHMIGHLMLIMVAPVLLVTGRPLALWTAASTPARRARLDRVMGSWPVATLTSPGVALALYTAVIVGAHLSGLTDDVLGSAWSAQVEQVVYLVSGVLFFALLFGNEPIPWKLSMPGRLLLLMFAMAVDALIGVVLLQSTTPVATVGHAGWGPSPLQDTQAGGAVMWVGGDGLMAAMAIGLYVTWARRPEATRRIQSVFERARDGLAHERLSAADRVSVSTADVDNDDVALDAYNRWLAQLNRRG